jgi:putative aldouronate transport system substrate-binding protein
MMKKKLSFVLALIMVASALAACGGASSQTSESSQSSAPSVSSDSSSGKTNEEPVKIVAACVDDGFSQYTDTTETQAVHDKILEDINVDLQPLFFPGDQYVNRVNLMLTTDDQMDIITRAVSGNFNRTVTAQWLNDGVIIDISGLVDEHMPNYKTLCEADTSVASARDCMKVAGVEVGVPFVQGTYHGSNLLKIRADWLETLGMSTPTTIEEFESYLEAVKTQDPDGNGVDDTYGLCGSIWGGNIVDTLLNFYTPLGNQWWMDEDDNIKPAEMHPGYKECLAKIVEWTEKGYLPPEALLSNDDQRRDWLVNNQIGTTAGWYTADIGPTVTLQEKIPEARYVPLCLTGKADAANAIVEDNAAAHGNVITASCKNPEAAARYLDYFFSDEGNTVLRFGIEGVTYDVEDGIPVSRTGDGDAKLYYGYYTSMLNAGNADVGFGLYPTKDIEPTMYLYDMLTTKSMELPGVKKLDSLVTYDNETMTGGMYVGDLETYLTENRAKVLAGEIPVSDWDSIMEGWLENGGKEYMQGRNEVYQEWLAENS